VLIGSVTLSSSSGSAVIGGWDAIGSGAGASLLLDGYDLGPAEITGTVLELAGHRGAHPVASRLKPRYPRLDVTAAGRSTDESNRLARALLAVVLGDGDGRVDVTLSYDRGGVQVSSVVQVYGKPTAEPDPSHAQVVKLSIPLIQVDPLMYDTNESDVTLTSGAPAVEIRNSGALVWPEFRVNVTSGTVTALTIHHSRGQSMTLSGLALTASSPDLLIVTDPVSRFVGIDGVPHWDRWSPSSQFVAITSGVQQLSISATGGSATADVSWRTGYAS